MLPIGQLSRDEKLRMMEALWNDLSCNEPSLPSPAWHGDALRDAENTLVSNGASLIDWDQAKRILLGDEIS